MVEKWGRWSAEDLETLKKVYLTDLTLAQIVELFPSRSRQSVMAKAGSLGMHRRRKTRYSSHYFCHMCGWVTIASAEDLSSGFRCPTCGRKLRTRRRRRGGAVKVKS